MIPKLSVLIPCWEQEVLAIKAVDSVPKRVDVEIIACDDGSRDNTFSNLLKYKEEHPNLNLRVYRNENNKGCAYNCNRLLSLANGEFVHYLGNDDTVITDKFSGLIDRLYGFDGDVMCFNLRINDGTVWVVNEESYRHLCAQSVRFIRKSITDGLIFPEHIVGASDWYFAEDLLKRNPKTVYTNILAYNYNHPRFGSLMNLRARGIIKE